MSNNIVMPEMGEGVIEGTVITWLKSEGDPVNPDEAVLEVETDKVTVEINAEVGGVILKTMVDEGETVSVGSVLAVIGEPGEKVEDKPQPKPENASAERQAKVTNGSATPPTPSRPKPTAPPANKGGTQTREFAGVRVSPVVARMVEEHDLDISRIEGTGRDGRVTKKDVLAYLEAQDQQGEIEPAITETGIDNVTQTVQPVKSAPQPTLPEVETANGDIVPLNGMRRTIAEHMVMSKRTSPHVTTVFEFDFSAVAAHRAENKATFAQDGIKLTYMPYLAQATAEALKNHPLVNASWTDEGILLKRQINIGIAVAVPKGLLVPVIEHADEMNLRGLARAINDVADRARRNKLQPDELKGGTFSITNHGASGSIIGTPIINQPQVGILGVGIIEKRVKVIGDAIAIRPCAYVSFSFDHRILDGATADNFVMDIKKRIENYA